MTATLVTLDKGGTSEMTLYVTNETEDFTKKISVITAPRPSGKRSLGPNVSKIVDLLRIEERITLKGFVTDTDKPKLLAIYRKGGSTVWAIQGTDYNYNMEKLTIITDSRDKADSSEDDDLDVTITGVKGVDI